MLKSLFKNKSIRDKLMLMNIIVVSCTLLFLFCVIVAFQYSTYKNVLVKNINSQLLIVEGNLGSALLFEDKAAANEILNAFKLDENIDSVYVELEDKRIFSGFSKGALKDAASINAEVAKGDLQIDRPIMVNSQRLGHIHVFATLNQVQQEIKLFTLTLLMVITCAAIFARLLSIRVQKYISEPINYLEKLVSNITKKRDYSIRSTITADDEFGALSIGINNMLDDIQNRDSKLNEELAQRIQIEKKLDQLAYFDNLTHLPNRHSFAENINQSLKLVKTTSNQLYLLFLDLDNFKTVNDSFGHQLGDDLLARCADRLSKLINENDKVFRIGGDEFAIILFSVKSRQEVEHICNLIIHALSQKFSIGGHEIFIGASIGIVNYAEDSSNVKSLIKHADAAMYWAKSAGKNTYKFYSLELEEANFLTQKLANDLQFAIEKNELELHYQPLINIDTAQVIGVEALLRWHNGRVGSVRPDIFIPIAESTGFIIPIGEWVIREALLQLKKWQNSGHPDFFIHINLSPRQLFDKRILSSIKSAITDLNINPKHINLELTESSLMGDISEAINVLTAIKSMGVGIAIDDFGTGHSSMSYLKELPVDSIKIDKSFVKGIPNDPVDCAIIDAIFALASSLKLDVVAEGVETEDQYEFLRTKHCSKLQGYLFSKPLPANSIDELLLQSNIIKKVASFTHKS